MYTMIRLQALTKLEFLKKTKDINHFLIGFRGHGAGPCTTGGPRADIQHQARQSSFPDFPKHVLRFGMVPLTSSGLIWF